MPFKGIKEPGRTLGGLATIAFSLFVVLLITNFLQIVEPPTGYMPNRAPYVPMENYNSSIEMKDPVVGYIRDVVANVYLGRPLQTPEALQAAGAWKVAVTQYNNGKVVDTGTGSGTVLAQALRQAVNGSLDLDMRYYDLNYSRFKVQFESPFHYSFVEFRGEAVEVIGDIAPVWSMDRKMVYGGIEAARDYLLRVIDPDVQGAHKYYFAQNDTFEDRVHCIYTASLTFSLIQIYDLAPSDELWQQILRCGEFLLSMQDTHDKKAKGAFYYSYYLPDGSKEEYFVVGTTSKTIYTLILLYEHTGDARYLSAAKSGADWLLTMQKDDGSVKSYIRRVSGIWYGGISFSFLFNGQVLSALSRMYLLTKDADYLDAARRIAGLFMDKIDEQGYYLGDDYRTPNPVSSSWVVLSLFDFYKASGERRYLDAALNGSTMLIGRQFTNSSNILTFGRFDASETSSGNGWLCEVLAELYRYLHANGFDGVDEYKAAIIKVTRWILQNTYTLKNSYMIKNPYMAEGGAFWTPSDRYVRTDAVCHAVNGLVRMYEFYGNGTLISVNPDPNPLAGIVGQ